MQTEDLSILDRAVESAPVLVITLGSVYLMIRMALKAWETSEDVRRRTMDDRHALYFSQLDQMNRAMVQAMDRGTAALEKATEAQTESTEMLGSVREILRK